MIASDRQNTISKFALDGRQKDDLIRANSKVGPHLDQVLDKFYEFAQADTDASRFFPNDEILTHAKSAQKRHWQLLLSGDFSDEYYSSAETIGRVHFRIQLPFELYLSGYARATSYIQEVLGQQYGTAISSRARNRLFGMLGALNRAFALDTHYVIEAYFAAQRVEQDTAFDYITKGIERMEARDLSELVPGPEESSYPERYNGVRETVNRLMSSLAEVIGTIQSSTSALSSAAHEIAESAQELSQRTETQAATLEQTAAAVEEITASMRASSEATTETSDVASKAQTFAEEGNSVVGDAVSKMQEIADSSEKMSQIIGAIDDISFQTNLLALNAGVEAARAGEAGRGFAVVASEVRALAQRAANSANEIKGLISVSVGHVEEGVQLVNKAGGSLNHIVEDVKRVSELTSEVSSSAEEQFTGLTEINTGVSHLDSVTQQNAAMVEETTAATRTMQEDARALADLATTFKVSPSPAQPQAGFDTAGAGLRLAS